MKKIFTHIFAIFMAVLVFYGGAGVNIISYCCKECRSAGIEALVSDKCCEIHNHSHSQANHKHTSSTSCCNHIAHAEESQHSSDDSCNIERIDFDWSSQNTDELEIDFSPNVHDLFSNNLFSNSPAHLSLICENGTVMPNGPPLACPRDYLSILTVLLI